MRACFNNNRIKQKWFKWHLIRCFVLLLILSSCNKNLIISVPKNASDEELRVAHEFEKLFAQVHPEYKYSVERNGIDGNIVIGLSNKLPLKEEEKNEIPLNNEGFLVDGKGKEKVIITSQNLEGLRYGSYQLLEKFGCRFLLDTLILPNTQGEIDFSNISFSNEPMVETRMLVNWEVYLEGSASWDLVDWKKYIRNSQRMGYNALFIHAYGNNPMLTFTFNGITKKVGTLTSSVEGRNWGITHLNDVRRIPGADGIFESPAFGSEIVFIDDEGRIKNTQEFYRKIINYASERGMKTNFAPDFDISTTFPQEMILTIPESDRYLITFDGIPWMKEPAGKYWLPRPDKPGGYRFFKVQAEKILEMYPNLTNFTMWKRSHSSIYNELMYDELPQEWKKEYNLMKQQNPEIDSLNQSVGTYVQAKIAKAYRQIFNELGREDIQLGMGTWRLFNIESMNFFLPEYVDIIPLDYEVVHENENLHDKNWVNKISGFIRDSSFVPIIWAHHDDGRYIGSQLPEYEEFLEILQKVKAKGFGVLHWTNRPLDIFFINHNRQVWKNTKNETIEGTCEFMAKSFFTQDEHNQAQFANYLNNFINEIQPMGRANSKRIFDRKISYYGNPDTVLANINKRKNCLEALGREHLSHSQKDFINFLYHYESFIEKLILEQLKFEYANALMSEKKYDNAKEIAKTFEPEKVLGQLSSAINKSYVGKADQGMAYSLGVRWLPHFITSKQRLGLEPVRINFGTTLHDPLAPTPGRDTYFIDKNKKYWKEWGTFETGRKVLTDLKIHSKTNYDEDIFKEGILINKKTIFKIPQLTSEVDYLPGKYLVEVLKSGKGKFDLCLIADDIPIEINKNQANEAAVIYEFEIKNESQLSLEIVPTEGGFFILNGLIIEIKTNKKHDTVSHLFTSELLPCTCFTG